MRERHTALTLRIAAGAALALSACGGPDAGPGFTVTDSAGVAIVANTRPAWDAQGAWRIDPQPIVDLGGDGSGPAGIFERVAGVVLLPDGGFVVADEGAAEIRAFDPAGGFRWRAGRPGNGPGEFRLLVSLGRGPADSIWAFDFGLRRFTLFNPSGAVLRTADIGTGVSAPSAVGRLADGRFVLREMWGSAREGSVQATGLSRDPAAIVALSGSADRLDTVAVYPGREVWLTVEDGRGVMSTPLFARNTAAAAADGRVVVGDQAAFVLDVFAADGARQRSIRLDGLDLAVTEDRIREATDALLEPLPRAERPARRAFIESLPGPSSRPAFGRILIAETGEIWVSEHVPPPLDPPAWHVFEATGRWLGTIAMPDRFRLEAVAADRIAGVWRDALDVERVRVHRLERGA